MDLRSPDTWEKVAEAIGHHPYEYDMSDTSERLDIVQIVLTALAKVVSGTDVVPDLIDGCTHPNDDLVVHPNGPLRCLRCGAQIDGDGIGGGRNQEAGPERTTPLSEPVDSVPPAAHSDGSPRCPMCNDEGVVHTHDGQIIGPCECTQIDGEEGR